eukprot:Ihof_evm7s192 gene=Ihof_evmTU7s192
MEEIVVDFRATNKKKFIPTTEWQVIEEGQSIPAGLNIRIDFRTGVKEAKLLDDTKNKRRLSGITIVDSPSGQAHKRDDIVTGEDQMPSETPIEEDSVEDYVKDYEVKLELEDDIVKGESEENIRAKVVEEYGQQIMADKRKKWSSEDIMQMTLLLTGLLDNDLETSMEILKSLEEEVVHDLDKALMLMEVGGLEVLVNLLNSKEDKLASLAALVLGSAVQSNPPIQEKAAEKQALPALMQLLQRSSVDSTDSRTEQRSLYALSNLLRGSTQPIYAQFQTQGGMKTLAEICTKLPLDSPLRMKMLLFVEDILADEVGVKTLYGEVTRKTQQETSSCSAPSKLVEEGWCEVALQQLKKADSIDQYDKVVQAMTEMTPMCGKIFTQDPLSMNALTDVKEAWKEQILVEENADWKSFLT